MLISTIRNSALLAALAGSTLLLPACDQFRGGGTPPPSPPAQPTAPVPSAQTTPAPPAPVVSPAQPDPAAPAAPPAPASPAKGEISLEVRSHIKQGFAYISIAKNARDNNVLQENIENAVNEFSQAIRKDPGYADAYSSRAVAYMQQKKFNKAQEDLKQAKDLAPRNAAVRYNSACLHSLKGEVDLALDEIDAALTNGFSNYDALRTDRDLDNARQSPEFRKILEKHKVFIVK